MQQAFFISFDMVDKQGRKLQNGHTCPADYATFWILKIGLLDVDLSHFSFKKIAIKFTFPSQFLLVSEKR